MQECNGTVRSKRGWPEFLQTTPARTPETEWWHHAAQSFRPVDGFIGMVLEYQPTNLWGGKWLDGWMYVGRGHRKACADSSKVYRVNWLWSKAQFDRWEEEIKLVRFEMACTALWFEHQKLIWVRRAEESEEKGLKGHACYAWKHVEMWSHFLQEHEHWIAHLWRKVMPCPPRICRRIHHFPCCVGYSNPCTIPPAHCFLFLVYSTRLFATIVQTLFFYSLEQLLLSLLVYLPYSLPSTSYQYIVRQCHAPYSQRLSSLGSLTVYLIFCTTPSHTLVCSTSSCSTCWTVLFFSFFSL